MILCKLNAREFKNWFLRLLGMSPARVLYIGGSDVLPPPLDRIEEERAVAAMENGDSHAKQTLIEHNLRLVVYISRRFENTGVGLEDLISIGTIGLIKAVGTFNSAKTSSSLPTPPAALKTKYSCT